MPDVVIDVRVIPRAKRNEFAGERDGALVVRLAAPPVEGSANEALVAFLAEALDLPRRNIRIVSGERSRRKRLAITGTDIDSIKARAGRR
jgi:uncharacterized protein (TIGR00251 family)